ncbi:hypothetical protein [Microbulbifer hainanensis]|uniref:hypothetical protein n=1 Tax=Microbulbifer hainanensis TaxID=2735675 RepID=UPI0018693401|nr:hypothetical protein [Microbulbifer hainanensis]
MCKKLLKKANFHSAFGTYLYSGANIISILNNKLGGYARATLPGNATSGAVRTWGFSHCAFTAALRLLGLPEALSQSMASQRDFQGSFETGLALL